MGLPHPAYGGTVDAISFNPIVMPGKAIVTAPYTIKAGSYKAGSILGMVRVGTVDATAAAVAGGTGNGTCTLANPKTGSGVKLGVYRLTCIEPAADGGTFQVEDPDGNVIGTAAVGVAFTGVVKFTIADGSADFVAGDAFTITVTDTGGDAGKLKLSLAAAVDGSAIPFAVLGEDLELVADKVFQVYVEGMFNETALVFGTGHDANSVRAALRQVGIYLTLPRYSFS